MIVYRVPRLHEVGLRALVAAVLGASLLLVGCGGAGASATVPGGGSAPQDTIEVRLDEWTLTASRSSAPGGTVTFRVVNAGAVPHDLVIVQADRAADDLPTAAGRVDESVVEVLARSVELTGGASEVVSFDLDPGSYVLICNVVGHYNLGQRAAFSVE